MTDSTTPNEQMSAAARQRVQCEIADGHDATNPAFIYSTTAPALLLAIAAGLIDPLLLAQRELANRGLDANGEWVGFDRAAQIHGVTR